MSATNSIKRGRGRPIGSSLGKYNKNPNQIRKGGSGRPKLILSPEEIETRKEKNRVRVMNCYRKKRAEELERRKKKEERMKKINIILEGIKQKLEEQEGLVDDIYSSDNEGLNNDEDMLNNEDIINFCKKFKTSPSNN